VARRRGAIEVDTEEDVRGELGALATLLFCVDPTAYESYARAQRFNAELAPVRQCARHAAMMAPRDTRDTPEMRRGRDECWRLVDKAGRIIDAEDWYLRPGMTTRAWAEGCVAHVLRASHPSR